MPINQKRCGTMQAINPANDPAPAPAAARPKIIFWLRICIYGLPLTVVILAFVIPNFVRAGATSCKNACVNNLRQIDAALEQAALALQVPAGTLITAAQLSPYFKGNEIPKCPGGGDYTFGRLGEVPTCSKNAEDGGHKLTP